MLQWYFAHQVKELRLPQPFFDGPFSSIERVMVNLLRYLLDAAV